MPQQHNRLTNALRRPSSLIQVIGVGVAVAMMALITPSPSSAQDSSTAQFVGSPRGVNASRVVPNTTSDVSVAVPSRPRHTLATTSLALQVATHDITASLAVNPNPVPTQGYLVSLIHSYFPPSAWRDAQVVAWCESKFQVGETGYDSNGTHDRGLFQLNDGGTQQYLFKMLGLNPNKLELAFNPVVNVRAAALLYSRDGWSQWSCASAL